MAASGERRRHRDREAHYRRAALAHPLRREIMERMFEGWRASADEIAAALGKRPERIAHHLGVLLRRGAVRAQEQDPGQPPLYRWAPRAYWARRLLDEDDPPEAG